MAFLSARSRSALCFSALSLWPCFALADQGAIEQTTAPVASDRAVEKLAYKSLLGCQFGLAAFVEKDLPQVLKPAFRLAWFNLKTPPLPPKEKDPSTVQWKWQGEVWADEIPLYPQLECKSAPLKDSLYPKTTLEEWHRSHITNYESLPTTTRETLRSIHFKLAGHGLPQNLTLPAKFGENETENCELQSLSGLDASFGGRNNDEATRILESCRNVKSKIVGYARVQWADRMPRSPSFVSSIFLAYELAQRDFADDLPASDLIGYRVAVLAADQPKVTDIFYRTALNTLKGKTLPDSFANILRHEICEKVGTSDPSDNAKVLLGTLTDSASIIRDILVPCVEDPSRPESQKGMTLTLVRKLMDGVESPKQSRQIQKKFFELSLRHSRNEAVQFSTRLATASESKDLGMSAAFWRGVSNPASIWADDAIKAYRKKAEWSDLDELRFKLFSKLKNQQAPRAKVELEILDERFMRPNALNAKAFRPLPDFKPDIQFDLDFFKVFEEEFRISK